MTLDPNHAEHSGNVLLESFSKKDYRKLEIMDSGEATHRICLIKKHFLRRVVWTI